MAPAASICSGTRSHESARLCDEVFTMWAAARAEANLAYDTWCAAPGLPAYAIYRAAEDRADAAEHDYAAACGSMQRAAA